MVERSNSNLTKLEQQQEQQNTRPYQNFIQSLKSDYTKLEYKKGLSRYLAHYNTTPEKMLSLIGLKIIWWTISYT